MIAKYTFLLPAFKAKYFEESLCSIKCQEYTEFKCIVSDDCSPEVDSSGISVLKRIFDKVVGNDPRFEYRRNEENMGSRSLVSHWNLLVDMCDTKYLIMASDDDVYEPNFLEEMNKLTKNYPKCYLFRARVDFINEAGACIKIDGEFDEYEDCFGYLKSHFSEENLKCIANYVFMTERIKELGGFHEMPLAWFSDQITAIKMSDNGCCNTGYVLFHFRISDINISGAKPSKRTASLKAVATMRAHRWLREYIKGKSKYSFEYKRWGFQIYEWLMDADFKTFIILFPQIISNGLWNSRWMNAITRHQLKVLITPRKQ